MVLRSSRTLLYVVAGLGLVYVLAFGSHAHRLVTLTMIAAVASKLLFSITLVGGFGRYHLRAPLLLEVVALAAWDAFLQKRRV